MDKFLSNLKNSPIGVMDSGVGGLTVLRELLNYCPRENYIYFGDTKNLPYGEKTKDELIKIVKEIYDYFQTRNVKAVVMACNTSSAVAYDVLKDDYDFQIYPLIQTVSKCLTTNNSSIKRIAVMATQATVDSSKYSAGLKRWNPDIEVIEQACPLFVPIVEKKITDYDEEKIFGEYFKRVIEFNPEKIILGCTHYAYLLDKLAQYMPRDCFINPASLFAEYIKKDLEERNLNNTSGAPYIEYCASASPEVFKKTAELFMKIDKMPELVTLK